MRITWHFGSSVWFKIVTITLLVAVLLVSMPAPRALAYTGGYGLNFGGDNEVMRADYYGVFGADPACRDTSSVTLWVRPLGVAANRLRAGSAASNFYQYTQLDWGRARDHSVLRWELMMRIWVWISEYWWHEIYRGPVHSWGVGAYRPGTR